MLTLSNLKRIEFDTATCTSRGEPVSGTERHIVIMFNNTVISTEEVNKLIDSGMYEYDSRVVVLNKAQHINLHDKGTYNETN